jgi:DnaJ-class molecular chaperone
MSRREVTVTALPDHYDSLDLVSTASPEEIERAYLKRAAELRVSQAEDAPVDLADVEEAHSVLSDPARRAAYDARVRKADEEQDKKDAEFDASIPRVGHRHGRRVRRSAGGVFELIWSAFEIFLK